MAKEIFSVCMKGGGIYVLGGKVTTGDKPYLQHHKITNIAQRDDGSVLVLWERVEEERRPHMS